MEKQLNLLTKKHILTITRSREWQKSLLVCLFVCCCQFLFANLNYNQETTQKRIITGIVLDTDGEALIGANIAIKGASAGTITDIDGKFSLEIESNSTVLLITYLGKKPVQIAIGNKTTLTIQMQDDSQLLQEVVVNTGYMTQKKADLTGALTIATADDIQQNPSANVMKSLQGKLPGVYITSNGNPSENVNIQIRGLSSIMFSSPPLIVIDGQPVDINLRDINSSDIESIQVLKDAASASIYGSRAASGVILLETKKGKKGDLKIEYDGYTGFSKLINKPNLLNTEEFGKAIWQATVNDMEDPAINVRYYNFDWNRDENGIPHLNGVSPVEWLNSTHTMRSANTDWWNEITQNGIQMNHQITISSGNEKSRSLFSMNYFNNAGTVIYSYFKRYSFRMNNDYDLIKDRLKIGETFTASYIDLHDMDGDNNTTYSIPSYTTSIPSIIPVYADNGEWGGSATELGMGNLGNPVRMLTVDKDNNTYAMKALGSAYLDFSILKNLHFKTQFGIDYNNMYYRYVNYTSREEGGLPADTENGVANSQEHIINYTWTNTLLYNLLTKKHRLDVLLGQEAMRYNMERFGASRDQIAYENRDYAFLDAATGDKKIQSGNGNEYRMLSYFAKANYSFNSKYLFSATIRYDGASKFGENNKYGTFPAFSAGWRLKNERFMENIDWLSELKFRASWGMNGNSNIPSDGSLSTYSGLFDPTAYSIKGNDTGPIPSGFYKLRTGNPNIKWEATQQTNAGIDFGFWNQRLAGSLDYFYKKTNNMLYDPPYIGALGEGGSRWVNAADMQNSGVELLLNYSNKYSSDFQYSITFTMSSFVNKIVSLPENLRYAYGGNGLKDDCIGKPFLYDSGLYYGYVADGIFKTQEEVDNSPEQPGKGLGRIRYKDLDGDGRIDDMYDRTWIGNPNPDFDTGLNLSASYKGFDCSVFLHGVFGQQIYNSWKARSDFWNITTEKNINHPKRVLQAWSLTNPNSDIPALSLFSQNGEDKPSSYYIENGSFVKLRTVEVGYTLPRKISEKAFLKRCRFYVSGHNLLTLKKTWGDDKFTGPDPENPGFTYRIPMSLLVGINLTF